MDLLGFEIIRENYRKERDDYKIDLACGPQEIELFIIKNGKLSYEDIAMYTELTLEEVEKIALEKKSA